MYKKNKNTPTFTKDVSGYFGRKNKKMISARLELATFCVLSRCDNRLHQETTSLSLFEHFFSGKTFIRIHREL